MVKLAFICHVSNLSIRDRLDLSDFTFKNTVKRVLGRTPFHYNDYGSWNTNTLKELEKQTEIEVHVITSHPGMKLNRQDFVINNIYYHCYNQATRSFLERKIKQIDIFDDYRENRRNVKNIISDIEPDIVYLVGAESPFYSLSGLDVDTNRMPLVVVMQTGLSDPDFLSLYPIMNEETYQSSCRVEQALFKKAQYIATDSRWYRELAQSYNPSLIPVRYDFSTNSANGLDCNQKKEFDFAYWAANIEKAGMDAIEAFCIAYKKQPSLKLNLIGGYNNTFKEKCDQILNDYEITKDSVIFSGFFPSHKEALQQVLKSRYALIPLKVDTISTSMREAAQLRLPIVTYRTKGTPSLNKHDNIVLLSDIGDTRTMADNMLKLVENNTLADTMSSKAYAFADRYWNNQKFGKLFIEEVFEVLNHFKNKMPISEHVSECIY